MVRNSELEFVSGSTMDRFTAMYMTSRMFIFKRAFDVAIQIGFAIVRQAVSPHFSSALATTRKLPIRVSGWSRYAFNLFLRVVLDPGDNPHHNMRARPDRNVS